MKKSLILYYIGLIFYLELANQLFVFNQVIDINLIYIIVNTFFCALIYNFFSHFFTEKINRLICYILTLITIIYFIFQIVFYSLFNLYFSFSTISMAKQALDFSSIALNAIIKNIYIIIILFIPLIILRLCQNKLNFQKYNNAHKIYNFSFIIIIYIISLVILIPFKDNMYSAYNLYFKLSALDKTIDKIGLLTTTRLDIKRTIQGFDEEIIQVKTKSETVPIKEKEYGYNKLDIDFHNISTNVEEEKNLLNYLENNIYTQKNEYTGYFKGKNLIFILAEGFNSIAVDQNLTPTLYKLTHSGFTFENYYSPLFLSTTGGEFQASTSLIPSQETLQLWKNTNPTIPYALGHQFKKLGYTTNSYHDWSYIFYKRHKTMPTLGFDNYLACGNGLEKEIDCDWLPSDIDMINNTFTKYASSQPFMTQYISVSGHAPYVLNDGNSIAKKNKDLVAELPYSESVKAYIATQIEFDRALETLINLLKSNNLLDDTVLVITGDHYPYSLSIDEINELSNYQRDETIEVNHSNLIIWNNKMSETINIKKVSSQIDVLPTILNLFDIPYDSRLLIGHDIFSPTEGLAIFSDRSWVSDKGKYYATTNKFLPTVKEEITQDYIDEINTRVANSFIVSNQIIKNNIYNKILGGN